MSPLRLSFGRNDDPAVRKIKLIVVGAILCLAATVAGVVLLVMWSIRQSEVVQMALDRVRKDPAAVERMGTPIKPGLLLSGGMELTGDNGTAEFHIPIHGPYASGNLYLNARKAMGEWTFNKLTVQMESGPPVVVVGAPARELAPPEKAPQPEADGRNTW